jgi:arsenate reductase (glutaredoxin)
MIPIIYHNPDCGTSRNVLSVLIDAGYSPHIIDYLNIGWDEAVLTDLLTRSGLTPRQALRETKSPAKDLGLLEENVSEVAIFLAMLSHPILVNRPFVVTPKGVRLCRPSERVLELLDQWPKGPYVKEDGSLMIDANQNKIS